MSRKRNAEIPPGREGWAKNNKGVLVPPTDPTHPLCAAVEYANAPTELPDMGGGPLRDIKAWKRMPPGIVLVLAECLHEQPMVSAHFDGHPVQCRTCAKEERR